MTPDKLYKHLCEKNAPLFKLESCTLQHPFFHLLQEDDFLEFDKTNINEDGLYGVQYKLKNGEEGRFIISVTLGVKDHLIDVTAYNVEEDEKRKHQRYLSQLKEYKENVKRTKAIKNVLTPAAQARVDIALLNLRREKIKLKILKLKQSLKKPY